MIYIDITKLVPSSEWICLAKQLTSELMTLPEDQRSAFIEKKRNQTWGAKDLLEALIAIVGRKCWYSEVSLEGSDPNVDHFRPKGQIREVDANLNNIDIKSPGYWWLAFECKNFRLSSMHANQRRVDNSTSGGKWDYFPVQGPRAPVGTDWFLITEQILTLDPCSISDVSLLWFDTDGRPSSANMRKTLSSLDQQRVKVTIWLYHLDKQEIVAKRRQQIQNILLNLQLANFHYTLWNNDTSNPDMASKKTFDYLISQIKSNIADNAEFASAKRCAIRNAIADYEWIDDFDIL